MTTSRIISTDECEAARVWDSESRNSPYSTVADIEDESCECCGGDHDISECS